MSISQVAQRHTWFNQCRTSEVAENLGSYLSCTECTAQRNDYDLILKVKIEDIPYRDHLVVNSNICSYYAVMTA